MKTYLPIVIAFALLLMVYSTIAAEDQAGREKALDAIRQSGLIIKEMQTNNFSVAYMNDTLISAKLVINQVKYAEMLRGNVTVGPDKMREARQALALIDWRSLGYNDVLVYTDTIRERKEQAFALHDSIISKRIEIGNYRDSINVTDAEVLVGSAQKAFYEDRYADADALLKQAEIVLESTSAETTLLAGFRRNVIGFLQAYWRQVSVLVLVVIVAGAISYPLLRRRLLKRRIKRLRAEESVLVSLMKEAQTQRFKEDKISGLVYNIRMQSYQRKLQKIKEILPVLEKRIKRGR